MSWLDLQVSILEEFGSVSLTERQRSAYDAWSARRKAHEREQRKVRREHETFLIRQLRAREARRVARTAWAALLKPDLVAAAASMTRRTRHGGIRR